MAKKRSGTGPANGRPGAASTPDDTTDESSNGSPDAEGGADVGVDGLQPPSGPVDDTDNQTVDATDDRAIADDTASDDDDDGSGCVRRGRWRRSTTTKTTTPRTARSNGRPTWTTGWQRLSKTFVTPPGQSGQRAARSTPAQQPTPDFSAMTDTQKRNLVNQIDPTERKIGYVASGLAVVLTLDLDHPVHGSPRLRLDDDQAERAHLCEPLHLHDAHRKRGDLQHRLPDEPLRVLADPAARLFGRDLRHRPHRSPGTVGVHVGPDRPGDRLGHRQHDHRPPVHLRRRLATAAGVAQPEVRLTVGQGAAARVHAAASRTGTEGRYRQRTGRR